MQPSPQRDAEFLGAYLLTLDLPIEIVISENDELSSPEMAANLKEFTDSHGINQIRWSLLEGESHFFPYEKAETMANWISRFWIERAKP